jgi:hypothetical protein
MIGFYEVLTFTRGEWVRIPKAYRLKDAAGRLFVLKRDPSTGATILWPAEVYTKSARRKSLDTPRPS